MLQERLRSHDMAKEILRAEPKAPATRSLTSRIAQLRASPREQDATWWNDLGGAYIRLGQPQETVTLLERVVKRFDTNYGIHANLGTAYHLLGRYQDAEKEIARDLEIDPNAHFGLEKYHLALLQYLARDTDYQKRHLYIDEWTRPFFRTHFRFAGKADGKLDHQAVATASGRLTELTKRLNTLAENESALERHQLEDQIDTIKLMMEAPDYRLHWDLASDSKLKEGTLYMAQLNPQQPACFVALGVTCAKAKDYNLAAAAFEKAINLGSPQSDILKLKAVALRDYVHGSLKVKLPFYALAALLIGVILLFILSKLRERRKRKATSP